MSVLPVDLQVLFSKASEHSENIARQSNTSQAVFVDGYEKIHQQSNQANETVKNLEQYDQDFTKINPESKKRRGGENGRKKKASPDQQAEAQEYKRAPTEEGTGRIIDIID